MNIGPYIKKFLVTAVVMLLVACAGTSFNWDQARSVKQGMTEAQLLEIMGNPYMVTVHGDKQYWIYSHATAFGGAKSISYVMKDGRVSEAPSVPEVFK